MKLVLDTNIVLDLWVFRDPSVERLRESLANGQVTALGTAATREELACVLAYGQMVVRMKAANISADHVLEAFDRHTVLVDAPAAAAVKCRDGDDQKFVDIAVAHEATLLSKDLQVLALRKKLAVSRGFSAPPPG